VVGDHVVLANCVALAGHVRIEDRCFLSGGVVVHQFSRVGKYAMIGGNAKVIQDVLPFLLIDGVPAKTRALNLVGLRRGGFSRDEIRALKQAFRTLAQAGPSRQEKLVQLAELDSESVRYLAKFIENSKRGYSGFVER
jgi:UDP-N-acetylglucosamine acyltransferase